MWHAGCSAFGVVASRGGERKLRRSFRRLLILGRASGLVLGGESCLVVRAQEQIAG